MSERTFQPDPDTKRFWDAADDGTLLVRRCEACGEAHYPPREHCPICHADHTAWEQASGEGTVYTFSVMRRGPKAPYAIAYVELAEGPRMLTNLRTDDFDALAIGDAVRVQFEAAEDGRQLPYFQKVET